MDISKWIYPNGMFPCIVWGEFHSLQISPLKVICLLVKITYSSLILDLNQRLIPLSPPFSAFSTFPSIPLFQVQVLVMGSDNARVQAFAYGPGTFI